MRYMLDTNICVFAIRQQTPAVLAALRAHAGDGIGTSSIAASELWFGVEKSASARNAKALTQFLSPLEIAPFDEVATRIYGRVRAALESSGQNIGPLDTLIAAHALALDVTLVTNNTREFRRVAGLRLVDWTAEAQ